MPYASKALLTFKELFHGEIPTEEEMEEFPNLVEVISRYPLKLRLVKKTGKEAFPFNLTRYSIRHFYVLASMEEMQTNQDIVLRALQMYLNYYQAYSAVPINVYTVVDLYPAFLMKLAKRYPKQLAYVGVAPFYRLTLLDETLKEVLFDMSKRPNDPFALSLDIAPAYQGTVVPPWDEVEDE
jgi:hypothetical protein